MILKSVKKVISIFVVLSAIACISFVWYDAGFMMVDQPSRIDEIAIHNSLYMLENGDIVRQRFVPRQECLNALELIVVNTSEDSTGELIIQILDMWGEFLKEVRCNLAEIEPGVYERIELDFVLPVEENEEFQICIYQVNASEIPGVVTVPYDNVVMENGICFFNDEVIEEKGLVVGYVYGSREFVGYKNQERAVIIMAVVRTAVIVLFSLICILMVYYCKLQKVKEMLWDYQIFNQMSLIAVWFSTFLLSAVINKWVTDMKIPVSVCLVFGFTFLLLVWTLYLYIKKGRRGKKKIKKLDRYCMLFLGVSGVLLRLPMFTNIQRWDGSFYYTHLHNASIYFDFTWQSVWDYFRLAAHPTFSYSFFMLIGEFLLPGKVTGVLLVQLVMTIAGIICIYLLFRKYWCKMAAVPAMLFTFIISVTPLFLGTFSYVNVDYTLLLFFIFLLYAVCQKKMILAVFWTIAIILNKETGWVIVAGYYSGYFIGIWFEGKGELLKDRIKRMCKSKMLYIFVVSGLVLGFYMIHQKGLTGWFSYGKYSSFFATKEAIELKGMGVNAIGFYPAYIFHRLGQIFLLNFMWVPTLIIIISCVLLIWNKGKMWGKGVHNLLGMVCSLVLFVMFSCLYITAALVRYTVFSSVIIWILALLLLYYVIAPYLRMQDLVACLGVTIVLLLVQNICYIDPASLLLYEKLDSGKGTILSTNMETNYYGDALVNNYRFNYLDGLLDKMLEEIAYDGTTYIFQCSEDESQIGGVGAVPHGWDPKSGERRYVSEETIRRYGELVPLNTWYFKDRASLKDVELPQDAIIYFLPYDNQEEEKFLALLSSYYRIGERTEVSNWGGSLYYYILEKI